MNQAKIAAVFLIFIHLVGAIGTLYDPTSTMVMELTPYNLIISCGLLIYFHRGDQDIIWKFFILSFIGGFAIEAIGVASGWPFGSYTYGNTLGVKWLEVPLVIGLNWFMLSYSFALIVKRLSSISVILQAAVGASLMVALDALIEPVAILLSYWSWEETNIPISNYLAWWVIAFLLQYFIIRKKVELFNPLVLALLIAQILYFTLIFFFY